MNQDRHKRKLSAIFSADVVGYSRLMEADEAWTIKSLEENKSLISNLIENYHGRVVDAPGDNILAEFSSVTNAVECAVKIQQELKVKNSRLKEEHQMEFRIGINLGEIVEEGGRIYGSGVNIAARIEGLSTSGGICISGRTYDHIKSKFDFGYEYLGEHNVKNISEPIRVYRVLMEAENAGKIIGDKKPSTLSEKPSIVVLPFVNMSNDPEQEYFSDGMTEELINALAKLEGLKVISRTSAFYFKGEHTDLRTIGEKLGVENVLEGSVRKAGNKLRITAQLIKVADDTHLWSEAYNRDLEDVFAIQEEISNSIVDSLKVRLLSKQKGSLVKTYTESIDAYEAYIKGRYFFQSFLEGGMEKALYYYNQAIEFDSDYAPAYSAIAEYYWTLPFVWQHVSKNEVYTKAREAVNTALKIDSNLPDAHANLGLIRCFYEWDFKSAEKALEIAIKLNPGLAKPHYDYGNYLAMMGNADKSILEARKAVELDPLSGIAHWCLGVCFSASGQFEKALKELQYAKEIIPTNATVFYYLVGTYTELGMFEEAMEQVNEGLDIFPRNPILLDQMGTIYARKGKKEKTQEILDNLLERSKKEYVTPFSFASLYVDLGEIDRAYEYLEEGYEKRDIFISFFVRSYRNDDRFDPFFKKIGL